MSKVMTLSECFVDFRGRFSKIRGDDLKVRQKTADILQVPRYSLTGYLKGDRSPVKDVRLRAIAFFDLLGYRVKELMDLKEIHRPLCYLLLYDLVSLEEAAVGYGFGHVKEPVPQLLKAVHTNRSLRADRENALGEFYAGYQAQLHKCREVFLADNQALLLRSSKIVRDKSVERDERTVKAARRSALPAVEDEVEVLNKPPGLIPDDLGITFLGQQLAGLLPVLQHIEKHGTSEDRAALRAAAGHKTVFSLNNVLSRLCGERARATAEEDV